MIESKMITFRVPDDLEVTPVVKPKVLLVGACVASHIGNALTAMFGAEVDHIHFGSVLDGSARQLLPERNYDFAVLLPPMDFVVPFADFFKMNYLDFEAEKARFSDSEAKLRLIMTTSAKWLKSLGLLLVVGNYFVPVQNPVGRLLPRYDLRNPVYFVEKLNEVIADEVAGFSNCYLVDLDSISATIGRQYVQDDTFWSLSHGGVLTDSDFAVHEVVRGAQGRLETIGRLSETQTNCADQFLRAAAREIGAIYRTTKQCDAVKVVITDLDDTLWRGIPAERNLGELQYLEAFHFEGLPLGYLEALAILKRRGVLLAIVSKNDFDKVQTIWSSLIGDLFPLSNFASIKVNWNDKATNVGEIISEFNILPKSVVFIDDNPVERAGVKQAFPDVRVLGAKPYWIRSVLLWSAETQVAAITDESTRRSDMVRNQIERDVTRKAMSREEFLKELQLKVDEVEVESPSASAFTRAVELLNKTNQFNTTGRRWTPDEAADLLRRGGRIFAFSAEDRFAKYGVIAIGVVEGGSIEQFVMSCRVIGLGVEIAALKTIEDSIARSGIRIISAVAVETQANTLSRDLYARAGYSQVAAGWEKGINLVLEAPLHIDLRRQRSR